MLLLDLITEQTITQPPKIPAAGGVPVPPNVNTAGDAAKAVIASPQPAPSTAKPTPTGQPAQQAQQAKAAMPNAQAAAAAQTAAQESQAELEERVMKRIQQLAGMLGR